MGEWVKLMMIPIGLVICVSSYLIHSVSFMGWLGSLPHRLLYATASICLLSYLPLMILSWSLVLLSVVCVTFCHALLQLCSPFILCPFCFTLYFPTGMFITGFVYCIHVLYCVGVTMVNVQTFCNF